MTYDEFIGKVKSLLLYDQDSDDISVSAYTDALIREWMSDIQYFVDNYRMSNENVYRPDYVTVICEGGLIDLPLELNKINSVSLIKTSDVTTFIISGAGSTIVNGKYVKDVSLSGEYNVYVKYDIDGVTPLTAIYFSVVDDRWYVVGPNSDGEFPYEFPIVFPVTDSPYDGLTLPYYYGLNDSDDPPLSGWSSLYSGEDPLPFISSDTFGCTSVVDFDPIDWGRRDEISGGKRCNSYTIDPRATKIIFYPPPEDDAESGEQQWVRVEWDGTKVEYSGEDSVPYGDDAVKNCADMINWNLALKKEDKPARANRFEKQYITGRTRLFKTQESRSHQI